MAEADDDRVAREMFDRVAKERDEARARNQQYEATIKDFALIDKAYSHFAARDDITDPYAAARSVVRDVTMKDLGGDDIAARLDGWWSEQSKLFGKPPAPPEPSAEKPAVPPPGAARATPSPAAGGQQPPPEPLVWNSPEVRAARNRGDNTLISRWIEEGRLKPSPNNPYARQAPR